MAKLEVKFELTGLKFEITGERDDVAVALAALQQQVTSLAQSVSSASGTLNGPPREMGGMLSDRTATLGQHIEGQVSARGALTPPTARAKGRRGANGAPRSKVEPLQFAHNAEEYGFPKQTWNTANKAMWLLHIMEVQSVSKGASAHVIAATFKMYFKEFGTILAHNIARDLGSAKKKGLVNSDPAKTPEEWYLLAAGKSAMQALIQNPSAAEGPATE